MKYIVDRFENEHAICESNGIFVSIPSCLLPPEAREGDIIVSADNESFIIDKTATAKKREAVRALMDSFIED